MRYDRGSTDGACIQARFSGMGLEGVLVSVSRSNVSVVVTLVVCLVVELPDWQLRAMSRRRGCRWGRWRQTRRWRGRACQRDRRYTSIRRVRCLFLPAEVGSTLRGWGERRWRTSGRKRVRTGIRQLIARLRAGAWRRDGWWWDRSSYGC